MTIEQHINNQYSRTLWPFFNSMELINRFGEEGREELNRMRDEGKIRKRAGANAPLVQLCVTEDGEIIKTY